MALADEDERELDLIFAETLRGGGRKRDQDKKARKQKMKKTKHVLRMVGDNIKLKFYIKIISVKR